MSLGFPRELFMDMYLDGREDITTYVRQTNPVKAKYGTADEQGKPSSFLTATLDNTGGRWIRDNPMSPYHGILRPNIECRWGFFLAQDTMSRTVSNGWGTMTSGDVWTSVGTASQFAVSSSGATHSISTTGTSISSVSGEVKRNVYLKIDYTPPFTDVTGASIEPANFFFRRVDASNMYLLRVTAPHDETGYWIQAIRIKGGVETFFGGVGFGATDHIIGQKVSIAAAIEGRTIMAKIWLASDPEPAGWHFSYQDTSNADALVEAGQWGVRSGVASGNTNTKPIVFTYTDFEARDFRAAGELSELPPEWDETHNIKTAKLRADGILRRLRQRNPPAKSSLRMGIETAADVVAYWSCEDEGDASTSIASSLPGGKPMVFGGADLPTFASDDSFACSSPIPVINGSSWVGAVVPYVSTGEATVQFLMNIPAAGLADETVLGAVFLTGTLWLCDIVYKTGGSLDARVYNRSYTLVGSSGTVTFAINGLPVRIQLNLVQNGSNVDCQIGVVDPADTDSAEFWSFSATGVAVSVVADVVMNSQTKALGNTSCGHIAVYKNSLDIFALFAETIAWVGETAMNRFQRLCDSYNIPSLLYGDPDDSAPMGAQRPRKLLDLITQCVATEQGQLYESKVTVALGMRSRKTMDAQDSVLELDYEAGEVAPPLKPATDDQGIVNDVLVKRSDGGEFRSAQDTGPRNVNNPEDDPEGVGRYEDELSVNTETVDALRDIADLAVLRGTTLETRYPQISLELAAPDVTEVLALQAMDVSPGDRVGVENLTDADIYAPIDQLVVGSEETLVNSRIHKTTFNAVPYSPYNVLTLDTDDARTDGDVVLAEDLDTTETAVNVTTVDAELTTDAGDHPYQVTVNGELMTVTACSGSGTSFTLTVTRSVNGAVRTHTTGDAVLLSPAVYLGRK